MDRDLEKLLQGIKRFNTDSNVNYDLFDKIEGDLESGNNIEIFWDDREESDKGYVFQLPNQELDDYDLCVHVNKVDNSDGMGDAPEEYLHLYTLVSLEKLSKIKILK